MAKSEIVRLRLTPEEKQAFERAAELSGLTLSAWVRERLRRAARIEMEEMGERVPFAKLPRASNG
jgi:uncharacterized protein (DUF1778 family)